MFVITDIQLGEGPDGWHVGRRARELEAAFPFLYISADSAASWAGQAVSNSRMITKPFAISEMVNHVSKVLEEGSDATQP